MMPIMKTKTNLRQQQKWEPFFNELKEREKTKKINSSQISTWFKCVLGNQSSS